MSRHVSVDHCILLLQHLSTYMHFITNGYKRFSKTSSTNLRQRVPLILLHLNQTPTLGPSVEKQPKMTNFVLRKASKQIRCLAIKGSGHYW